MRREFRIQNSELGIRARHAVPLLLTFGLWLLAPAALHAATHVTASYDLGANPQVMTTVGGQPQYGLVFAQRNKSVTYNSVEYPAGVVKGYLDANGELNDGAGNLWLDLVPNLGATPADSYYVVTVNIQGNVHAEIWVLPDVPTVAADTVRQTQPPSATSSGFDLSMATGLLALTHGGTGQSSWTAERCVRVNSAGTALESAAADCGTGGGSAPVASATVSGTVKTDSTVSDPVVYLTATADTLLAGKANSSHTHSESEVTNLTTDLAAKAPTSRNINTTSPLSGGGDLSADRTLSCPTCEVTGNKNAASGYAGLTVSTKLNAAQGQEVWSATDLTDYASTSGTGAAAIRATITTPSANDVLAWSGSNWVNQAPSGGSNHNILSSTHSDSTTGSVARGDLIIGQGASPTWTRLAKGAASQCLQMDGTGTDIVWGSCAGGGGGDNVSVNGVAASDADFDDAAPAAPSNGLNVKWQKDTSSPDNISAYVPWAQGTITSSTPILNHTATWNSGATTFVNIFSNVTNTASAAGSLLIDLQLDSASKFKVDKAGALTTASTGTFGSGGPGIVDLPTGSCGVGASSEVRFCAHTGNVASISENGGTVQALVAAGKANTWTAGAQDMGSAASFKVPTSAGASPTASGLIAYDSTANKFEGGVNGASHAFLHSATGTVEDTMIADGAVDGGTGGEIADGSITSADLATANKTFPCNFTLFDSGGLQDTDDVPSVSNCSRPGRAITITQVICECDAGTPRIQLQRDDGSAANMLTNNGGAGLDCTTGGATGTLDGAEDNFASTDRLDFVMVSASTATRINVFVQYTVD